VHPRRVPAQRAGRGGHAVADARSAAIGEDPRRCLLLARRSGLENFSRSAPTTSDARERNSAAFAAPFGA